MSKILCPVDFSSTSLNAVEYAANIASASKRTLKLLNVFTEQDYNKIVDEPNVKYSFKELLFMARNRMKAIEEEVKSNFEEKGLPRIETEVRLGELQPTLLNELKDTSVDLVVMGTSGIGKSPIFGTNTSQFLSKSNVSVLSIPKSAHFKGFRKLIYATDIKEEDKLKIQEVTSFATYFGSRIYTVHLYHKKDKPELTELKEFYNELKSFTPYDMISYESVEYEGNIGKALMNFMDTKEAGLLVVYSKSRNYLENIIHKSVARELAVTSTKPLLVLK